MSKKKTSVALTGEAIRLLGRLASEMGISKSAVLEVIIRQAAEEKGIDGEQKDSK